MRIQDHSRSSARSEPCPSPSSIDPQSSERSLAVRCSKHNVKPPDEWWNVQPSTARTPKPDATPDHQEEDEEQKALEYNENEVDELVMHYAGAIILCT